MSTATAPELPTFELVYDDGEPMDTPWHRAQMEVLIQSTHSHWRDRSDFYTGGNMFVYFSFEQARTRDYRGPDYFTVVGVDGTRERKAWVVWEEGGRYPDIIIELLSPSTRSEDLGTKKNLYERVFRTLEYFCYDPESRELSGWRLVRGRYEPIEPDAKGRMESDVLGTLLGTWEGTIHRIGGPWIRLWDRTSGLVPLAVEQAEAERARAAVGREAGHMVGLFYRQGLERTLAALRELGRDRVEALIAAIDAMDPEVARALLSAGAMN